MAADDKCELFTAELRYHSGRRWRVTLRRAQTCFIDSDGIRWDLFTGDRIGAAHQPQSKVKGTSKNWIDKNGYPMARLIVTTVRPIKDATPAMHKQMTHTANIFCQRSRIRVRETAKYWVDEHGNKFDKLTLASVNFSFDGKCITKDSIQPIDRYRNGIIIPSE